MKIAFFRSIPNWWYDKIFVNTNAFRNVPTRLFTTDDKGRSYLRIDYAVAYTLRALLPTVEIDILSPDLANQEDTYKKYDLIINQFLSPLSTFHSKRYGKDFFTQYDKLAMKYRKKVYPPPEYTRFIEDKCLYTRVLQQHKIPVARSICVNSTDYRKNKTKTVESVLKQIREMKWMENNGSIFLKPILGTGSWGTLVFKNPETIKRDIETYLEKSLVKKSFPSIMIQKNFEQFGTSHWEIRQVFIGQKYIFTGVNNIRGEWDMLRSESGTYDVSSKQLKRMRTISSKILSKIVKPMFGDLPLLETRIDFGCCLNSNANETHKDSDKYFINEVEYAGGLMTFLDGSGNGFGVHEHMADQLKKVANKYKNLSNVSIKSI